MQTKRAVPRSEPFKHCRRKWPAVIGGYLDTKGSEFRVKGLRFGQRVYGDY